MNSEKPSTSSIIYKILLNKNLVVTYYKLKELLKIKGVGIDLTVYTPDNKKVLNELAGKSA
jgi:hypothetical protein